MKQKDEKTLVEEIKNLMPDQVDAWVEENLKYDPKQGFRPVPKEKIKEWKRMILLLAEGNQCIKRLEELSNAAN